MNENVQSTSDSWQWSVLDFHLGMHQYYYCIQSCLVLQVVNHDACCLRAYFAPSFYKLRNYNSPLLFFGVTRKEKSNKCRNSATHIILQYNNKIIGIGEWLFVYSWKQVFFVCTINIRYQTRWATFSSFSLNLASSWRRVGPEWIPFLHASPPFSFLRDSYYISLFCILTRPRPRPRPRPRDYAIIRSLQATRRVIRVMRKCSRSRSRCPVSSTIIIWRLINSLSRQCSAVHWNREEL